MFLVTFLPVSCVSLSPLHTRTPSAKVGLGVSYALAITRTLSLGVRSWTALENHFNAVERVQEFIDVEQEVEGRDGVRMLTSVIDADVIWSQLHDVGHPGIA